MILLTAHYQCRETYQSHSIFYVGSLTVLDAIIPYLSRWLSQGLFCPTLSMSMQTLEDEVTQTSISIDCELKVTYNLQTDEKI